MASAEDRTSEDETPEKTENEPEVAGKEGSSGDEQPETKPEVKLEAEAESRKKSDDSEKDVQKVAPKAKRPPPKDTSKGGWDTDCLFCTISLFIGIILLSGIGLTLAYMLEAPLPWHWVGLGPKNELTSSNWDEKTKGKEEVFIKFYAPWCGHCKRMAPDWESIIEEFEESKEVFIGSVDCVGAGADLCKEVGITGFPTLRHGDPTDRKGLEDYAGGRNIQELRKFAKTMGPKCSPLRMDLCDEEQKVKVQEYMNLDPEKVKEMIDEKAGKIKTIEEEFEKLKADLTSQYTNRSKEKDESVQSLREPLMTMKAVHRVAAENAASATGAAGDGTEAQNEL